MTESAKKVLWIAIVFLVLITFAWHSLSMLASARGTATPPVPPAPTFTEGSSSPSSDSDIVERRILTNQEIETRIEEKQRRLKTLEALKTERQKKADIVIARVREENHSPVSPELKELKETIPAQSDDAEKERSEEILNGIRDHRYFAH